MRLWGPAVRPAFIPRPPVAGLWEPRPRGDAALGCGGSALAAMRRWIDRRIFRGASTTVARMGAAPLVSSASADASAPPLPRFAAPTRTPWGCGEHGAPCAEILGLATAVIAGCNSLVGCKVRLWEPRSRGDAALD